MKHTHILFLGLLPAFVIGFAVIAEQSFSSLQAVVTHCENIETCSSDRDCLCFEIPNGGVCDMKMKHFCKSGAATCFGHPVGVCTVFQDVGASCTRDGECVTKRCVNGQCGCKTKKDCGDDGDVCLGGKCMDAVECMALYQSLEPDENAYADAEGAWGDAQDAYKDSEDEYKEAYQECTDEYKNESQACNEETDKAARKSCRDAAKATRTECRAAAKAQRTEGKAAYKVAQKAWKREQSVYNKAKKVYDKAVKVCG